MTKAEVIIIRKSQVVEETILLEKIQRNEIKEQEEKSMFQIIGKYESKSYKKVMTQWI